MTKKEFKKRLKPLSNRQLNELLEDIEAQEQTFEKGSIGHDQATWCIKQVQLHISGNEINEFLAIYCDFNEE